MFSDKPLTIFAPRDFGLSQKRRRGDCWEITEEIWVRRTANISTRWVVVSIKLTMMLSHNTILISGRRRMSIWEQMFLQARRQGWKVGGILIFFRMSENLYCRVVDGGPPTKPVRRTDRDGNMSMMQRLLLYDFLEERDGQLVLPLDFVELLDLYSDEEGETTEDEDDNN